MQLCQHSPRLHLHIRRRSDKFLFQLPRIRITESHLHTHILQRIITHRLPLSEFAEAIEISRGRVSGAIKVLLTP